MCSTELWLTLLYYIIGTYQLEVGSFLQLFIYSYNVNILFTKFDRHVQRIIYYLKDCIIYENVKNKYIIANTLMDYKYTHILRSLQSYMHVR